MHYPARRPAASCTPSTTCCRSPTTAGSGSRSPCPTRDPHIPVVVAVYPTNDWHERETYDFFGIVFDGHPALTRILMPDDWPGHPQRKDYPLGGIPVEYKGAHDPAARPAEVVHLMRPTRHLDRPTTTSSTRRTDGDAYAGSYDTTEGRVYTVTGGDWDTVVAARRGRARSASSSTWARSTRRPTACCG